MNKARIALAETWLACQLGLDGGIHIERKPELDQGTTRGVHYGYLVRMMRNNKEIIRDIRVPETALVRHLVPTLSKILEGEL